MFPVGLGISRLLLGFPPPQQDSPWCNEQGLAFLHHKTVPDVMNKAQDYELTHSRVFLGEWFSHSRRGNRDGISCRPLAPHPLHHGIFQFLINIVDKEIKVHRRVIQMIYSVNQQTGAGRLSVLRQWRFSFLWHTEMPGMAKNRLQNEYIYKQPLVGVSSWKLWALVNVKSTSAWSWLIVSTMYIYMHIPWNGNIF